MATPKISDPRSPTSLNNSMSAGFLGAWGAFPIDAEETRASLRRSAGWFIALGIALLALGVFSCLESVAATLMSVSFLGAILVVAGVLQAIQAFHSHQVGTFFLHLLGSILYFVVGILTWRSPAAAALGLTLMMAAFFLVNGLFRLFSALALRVPHRSWLLVNGAVTFLLGILILAQWPGSGLWVLGLFVGIDLLFAGWSLLMLGIAARRALAPISSSS